MLKLFENRENYTFGFVFKRMVKFLQKSGTIVIRLKEKR